MKLIRKLDIDDITCIIRNYFNIPKADISIDIVDTKNGLDVEVTIEEDGYEVS